MTACTQPGQFYGVETATLQTWLAEAQQALHDLQTGAKGETYSYTQGDGAKAVTFSKANIGALSAWIAQLLGALGYVTPRRRPIGFTFQ